MLFKIFHRYIEMSIFLVPMSTKQKYDEMFGYVFI